MKSHYLRMLLILVACFVLSPTAAQAQPSENWTLLYTDKMGAYYIHPESANRPSKDVVVYWSKWVHSNGASYKFKNKLWRERRYQLLAGFRSGKPMSVKFPSPIAEKLDKNSEAHYQFFFSK